MASNTRIFLFILALWASRETVHAQDAAPVAPKVLGRILVLDSERCLEGEVEAVDDRYRVRRGRSEVWISGAKVLRVCPDWAAAYRFMKQRANLDDPDERLRLARWCQLHNLLPEALGEAETARHLRPLHTETRHLISVLKEIMATRKTAPVAATPMAAPIDVAAPPDLTPETAAHFAVKIQPILSNTCIHCHSGGKGGGFQLYRSSNGGQKAALQGNLASVLGQVRFDNPRLSPLLIKAISPHGPKATPPLAGKKAIPYQVLESWVQFVVENHPHLREQALARMPVDKTVKAEEFASGTTAAVSAGTPTSEPRLKAVSTSIPTPSSVGNKGKTKVPPAPVVATTPGDMAAPAPALPEPSVQTAPAEREERDVYSPADFNRVAHPGR